MKNTHTQFSIFNIQTFISQCPSSCASSQTGRWLVRGQTWAGLRASPSMWQERRSLSTSQHAHMNRNARTHEQKRAHTHAHARSQCPLSVAGECPVKRRLWLIVRRLATCSRTNRNTSRPMRMYWKNTKVGSRSVRSALVRRERNQCMTVQLMSAPSSSAGVLIQAVEKLSPFPAWHHN